MKPNITKISPNITKQSEAVMHKMRPNFRVDVSEIPEAKKWEVGKIYKVELTVKQMSIGISYEDEDSEKQSVEFQIQKIQAL